LKEQEIERVKGGIMIGEGMGKVKVG